MTDLTKDVVTRDGRPARIVATQLNCKTYPIGAIVTEVDGGETFHTYTSAGAYSEYSYSPEHDLVNPPVTKTLYFTAGDSYSNFHAADGRYATDYRVLKVVIEEGTNKVISSEVVTA